MPTLKKIGGKNYNLMKIKDVVNVPSFEIISSDLFVKFISEYKVGSFSLLDFIENELRYFWHCQSMLEQRKISECIQDIILSAKLPDYIEKTLKESFNRLQTKNIVMRSSAGNEDSKNLSFAGIYNSYLNLNSEDKIFDAYKKICASAYSSRALLYHQDNGIKSGIHDISICMMEMIDTIKSGVAFTCDTSTGYRGKYNELVHIELVNELSEDFMQGFKDASSFVSFFDENMKEMLLFDTSLHIIKIETIKELANIVRKLAKLYNDKIIDVEFCIDKNEKIWIVQTRLETYWNFKDI